MNDEINYMGRANVNFSICIPADLWHRIYQETKNTEMESWSDFFCKAADYYLNYPLFRSDSLCMYCGNFVMKDLEGKIK